MIDIAKIKKGDKVHYLPSHYRNTVPIFDEDGITILDYEHKWENGIVKEVPDWTTEEVRVVYNCNGDWQNYEDYTSALTHVRDLFIGWRH